MNIYIISFIIFIIIILIIYCIQNNIENFESSPPKNQSLTGIDDANSINTLAQISTQLIEGGLTVPGDMNLTGKLNVSSNSFTLPKGIIVEFNSTVAPDGWAICDGTNGTPDLRNKFIIGAKPIEGPYGALSIPLGKTGGNQTISLAPDNLPPHRHISILINPDGSGPRWNWGSNDWLGNGNPGFSRGGSAGFGTGGSPYLTGHGTRILNGESGLGSTPIDILPPFYALTYIMKI